MDREKLLARAARYCSTAERAPSQVEDYLTRQGVAPEDRASIMGQLQELGFLSESRYAWAFSREKARFAGWGRRKIEAYLRHKRIGEAEIENALRQLQDEGEAADILTILRRKLRSISNGKDPKQLNDKLLRFAISRGFEPDETFTALRTLLREENEVLGQDEVPTSGNNEEDYG